MRIDPNDPRITAYVLGELDETERAALERELEQSPEARQTIEETHAMAELLTDHLSREPMTTLTEDQRRAVERRLTDASAPDARLAPVVPLPVRRSRAKIIALAAMAASVVLVGVGVSTVTLMRKPARPEATLALSPATTAERSVVMPSGAVRLAAKSASTLVAPGQTVVTERDQDPQVAKDGTVVDGEDYAKIKENRFRLVSRSPLSTFSIDVDTAAYANVRRFLAQRTLPPKNAVRIEELINYFPYAYPQPTGNAPFSVNTDVGACPWKQEHRLVRIGLKGRELKPSQRPRSNLVFLIDVSGSMSDANKLPLLRSGLSMMVQQLTENDRVAMVVYASSTGLVLPSTAVSEDNRSKILSAIERLEAGGSTDGGSGIQLAYNVAVANFIKGGTNRVILATDGDFNVGVTDRSQLLRLIKDKAQSGVFLTVLGFGMGNLKDATLEQLANKGNGNYAYIDTLSEARKVLVEQMSGTLVTIAKDVKIQVEFNPARVSAYRLIGYENRLLAAKDFNDDKKDAGEIGAGHTVTALYEIVPVGQKLDAADLVDPLKYQAPGSLTAAATSDELLTVKLRYKAPDADTSTLIKRPVRDRTTALSGDFRFAAAVAWFGMTLRGSKYAGQSPWGSIIDLAEAGLGRDPSGYRAELIQLVRTARQLSTGERSE